MTAKRQARAERDAKMAEMYARGASLRDVAAAFGMTAGGVKVALDRIGVSTRDRSAAAYVLAARAARAAWPDCPPDKAEAYAGLCKVYPPAEARRMLEWAEPR